MTFQTVGHNFYPEYHFPVSIYEDGTVLKEKDTIAYYKIVFLEEEQSVLLLNGNRIVLAGPHLICLNEKDEAEFVEPVPEKVQILFFQPMVFNGKMSFEVCNRTGELSIEESQDAYYFNRFRWDTKLNRKILPINENIAKTVGRKYVSMKAFLEKQTSPYWPCMCRTNVLEILFYLAQIEEEAGISEHEKREYSQLTQEVIAYLQVHYGEKLTMEMLAPMFGTNRTTLVNDFKKSTGKSLNRYLIQMRIQIATTLLKDTLIPIAEICDRTGFYDMSYFSKIFKKEMQYTPAEFRKIYNRVEEP